jgi:fatty-acyl-CoA synthase
VIHCPLPLHHATAVTVAMMPAIVQGVTLYLPGRFSASRFWDDVQASGATQLVYVGDLLRFVLAATPSGTQPHHRLRVAVGNGLDAATWHAVLDRFAIPKIIEFYGATESPSVLLNFSGKLGSIGRVPLRELSRYAVVRNAKTQDDAMDQWVSCAPGVDGELWIRLPRRSRPWLGNFEGYLQPADEQRALTQNVFRVGDRFYRTYDLVRYDSDDFLYFVGRSGDSWRNRGHNVSTVWLANCLREAPGIADACILPVAIDDSPRRFGLVVVVTSSPEWLGALEAQFRSLPSHCRPDLVQCVRELPRTSNFKLDRRAWHKIPWEPNLEPEPLFVWRDGLHRISAAAWPATRDELLRT